MTVIAQPGLDIRLLGPVSVSRGGAPVALPRSRKVRVLLALLTVERAPMTRSRLCDLLWNTPNDPRGELRWCLSKLRGVVDDQSRCRVLTAEASLVSLDLAVCAVDVREIDRHASSDVCELSTERLMELGALFGGEFLEGVELDGPELTGWLVGQRQRYWSRNVAIARELTLRAPKGSKEAFRWLERWLELAPHEHHAHEAMIEALVACGRASEAEVHASSAIRAFEQEGLDWTPLREAWRAARRRGAERVEIASRRVEPQALGFGVPPAAARASRRGAVVVMPFSDGTPASVHIANGLTDDIITRLAKLRVLFVIARGTSYALSDRGVDPREAGRILNVEYVVNGSVRRRADRMTVAIELSETREAGIVWADEVDVVVDETFSVLDASVDRIVAEISKEIEREESRRALMKPPSSLDAWEAYHRGLWHMYRFTRIDNEKATALFRDALALDPTFARAYAGLSFTHFQNVFLDLTPDRDRQMTLAVETAGQSLASDDRDPAAHWAMGRALWLRGDHDPSLVELGRTIELSPNFALGHYTLGFVLAQSGDPRAAIDAADHSRQLSPFDPLQFGMLGSRALAHMRLGEREEAAEWAVKAATRPNAHAHILAIAAANLGLSHRRAEAGAFVARIRTNLPSYTIEDFLRAFRFDADAVALIRQGAKEIGFDG